MFVSIRPNDSPAAATIALMAASVAGIIGCTKSAFQEVIGEGFAQNRGLKVRARHARVWARARESGRLIDDGDFVQAMTAKCRTRKTTARDRGSIMLLYSTGWWSMRDLGALFNITSGRVSQIVNDTYGEAGAVAHDLNP